MGGERQRVDSKLYAYDLARNARNPGKDFDGLRAAGIRYPRGIWSDGETMWVAELASMTRSTPISPGQQGLEPRRRLRDLRDCGAAGNHDPERHLVRRDDDVGGRRR